MKIYSVYVNRKALEIKIDKREDNSALVTVHVAASDYTGELEKGLIQYQKKANIKGFRQGKAPLGLLKKMMGTEMKADAIISAVNKGMADFMEKEALHPMFMPLQHNNPLTEYSIANDDEYAFEFEVLPEPAFDFPLESMVFEKFKLVASDSDLDEAVERAQESVKNVVPVDTIAKGDFIRGIFRNEDGTFENESVLPTPQVAEEGWAPFEGKSVGDTIAFDLRAALPEDKQIENMFFPAPEEMEKFQGMFTLEVTEITRDAPSELNKEFFDKIVGPDRVNTLEEFRAAVKEDMESYNRSYATSVFHTDLRKTLLDAVDFVLPKELLAKVLKYGKEEAKTDEEVESSLPAFLDAVKWQAISNRIAREAGIKIAQEEVNTVARSVVASELSRMGLNLPEEQLSGIIDYMLKGKDKDSYLDKAYEVIFSNKLGDYITSKAIINEREVGFKEFNQIIEERNKKAEALAE